MAEFKSEREGLQLATNAPLTVSKICSDTKLWVIVEFYLKVCSQVWLLNQFSSTLGGNLSLTVLMFHDNSKLYTHLALTSLRTAWHAVAHSMFQFFSIN